MFLKIGRTYLPFLIGLLSGIYFFNLDLISPYGAHLPGDLGDARFNQYLLEHAHRFFIGANSSFWNAAFLYPEENVITYSDNLLGSAPFYSLFRLCGLSSEISFQYWFVLISALNYTTCYFLCLYVFKNKYAAALGAMVFAFSIALQSQMGHAQTFPRFAIPLTLLMAVLYLKELRPLYFFMALFFFVYQMYCGLYLGFMLSVPLGFLFLFSLIFKWRNYVVRSKEVKWWLYMFAALAVTMLLLAPLMLPYLKRAQQVDLYSYARVLQTVPTLRSYFYAHYGSLFWDVLKDMGVKYERFWDHQIFAGGVALLSFLGFAIVVLAKTLRAKLFPRIEMTATVQVLFFSGLITFLFYIRFQGHSLYQVLHALPGFASMRALQRIINIELVFYALATAFMFSLVFRKQRTYNGILFLFFVALLYLDNHIHPDTTDRYTLAEAQQRKNDLLEKVKGFKAGTIISYEPDTLKNEAMFYQLDAMLAAQEAGLKTINGYTANSPDEYSPYWMHPNEENRLRWLKKKNSAAANIVVVH